MLSLQDDKTPDGYVVDKIRDCTGMKGTGMWTVKEGAERSVPAPTIAAALDARFLSGRKDEVSTCESRSDEIRRCVWDDMTSSARTT